MSNGDLKKVEDLCSQDFIDSAESSPDVRISHSTVTYIDPNSETGSGTISFAVGKHKIKVCIIFIPRIFRDTIDILVILKRHIPRWASPLTTRDVLGCAIMCPV